jgi:hypothetical protein
MLEQYADPQDEAKLFEVEFRPTEEFLHKGNFDQPTIKTLRGRRNRILVGVPQVINILTNWPLNDSLAEEIKALQDRWDFYNVRLACSFAPDRGCRFVWGRMQIDLLVSDTGASSAPEAIAFDLFPRDIGQTRVFHRQYKIAPMLKFAFAETSAEASGDHEIVRYEPTIIAIGLLTSTPSWTFSASSQQALIGSRELFLLVKNPKGAIVQARFALGAEVQSTFGPLPVKGYRDDDLVGKLYPLIP